MLLFDCAEVRGEIQRVKLNEKDLTTLIERYNRCKGSASITFKAKKPWTKARMGITGGLNVSQLNLNTANSHLKGGFDVSKSPTIGISLDVLYPRLTERVSFHLDVLYLDSKYHNYNVVSASYYTARNHVIIELQQLKIPVGLRYTLPERKFTPYFNLGLSGTIHLNASSKWIQDFKTSSRDETNISEPLTIKETHVGIWGGVGALKSISRKLDAFVELRYERTGLISRDFIDPPDLESKIQNFQILIGVRTK